MMPSRVDVGRVIDEGAWSGYQQWIVLLVALTIIFDGIDNQLLGIGTPRAFSTAVLEFLLGEPDGSVETGTAVRRAVLGEAHVDRAAVSTTELTRDFQQLIAQFAWGTVWARPGLDHRTRRMLALAITASLGRWDEFRLHVRTGLAGDFEPCDLEEVLMTVALYAGVPAAHTGFHIVTEEISE